MTPDRVPDATFRIRQRTLTPEGTFENDWGTQTTADIFDGRKIVLFAVPGASRWLVRHRPAIGGSSLPATPARTETQRESG